MDILKFINSKNIHEHLKAINYGFNSLETSWLIYQSRNAKMNNIRNRAMKIVNDEIIYTV